MIRDYIEKTWAIYRECLILNLLNNLAGEKNPRFRLKLLTLLTKFENFLEFLGE